jgi:hypothetical protein
MAIDNWKLWLVPFALWGLVMTWYSGYQSGYQDGHETAWEMSRQTATVIINDQLVLNGAKELAERFATK